MKVNPKCADVEGMLVKLKSQIDNVPQRKMAGYAYTKRSLELMSEGHTGSVMYNKAGDIVGAASYYIEGESLWVETFGSIGTWDGATTPGMGLMYDVFKEAQHLKNVRLHSLPGHPVDFYKSFFFKGTAKDALDMTADSSIFTKYMKWYEDNAGITAGVKSTDKLKLGSVSEIKVLQDRIDKLTKKNKKIKTKSIRARNNAEKRALRKEILALEAGAEPAVVAAKSVVPKPVSGVKFKNTAHQSTYNNKFIEHTDAFERLYNKGHINPTLAFDESTTVASKNLSMYVKKSLGKTSVEALDHWQRGGQTPMAELLRYYSSSLEPRLFKSEVIDKFVYDTYKPRYDFTEADYINIRAMNQAYIGVLKKNNKVVRTEVYRGIGGEGGHDIAKDLMAVKRKPKVLKVEEQGITCYSGRKELAAEFGDESFPIEHMIGGPNPMGGITYTRTIDSKNIILHEDLFSGVTDTMREEREYIVQSGKIEIPIKNVAYWYEE
jgi:hypothetical protein